MKHVPTIHSYLPAYFDWIKSKLLCLQAKSYKKLKNFLQGTLTQTGSVEICTFVNTVQDQP
jgi:hypothetical protein